MIGRRRFRRVDRHNRRYEAALEHSRASGDRTARVWWLRPRDSLIVIEYPKTPSSAEPPGPGSYRPDLDGLATPSALVVDWPTVTYLRHHLPVVAGFPPAYEDRWAGLSPLFAPTSFGAASSATAGDHADVARWHRAAADYLAVLDEAGYAVRSYWTSHGHAIPLRRPAPLAFRRWQTLVEVAFARVQAASDRYRPVHEEVREACTVTEQTRAELFQLHKRLARWERRRRWHLLRDGDTMHAFRSDVAPALVDTDTKPQPLRAVAERAISEQHRHLCPVVWDDASVTASDAELATVIGDRREYGRTRSGAPMAVLRELTFATWFTTTTSVDYRTVADRERLAAQRESAARESAERVRRRRVSARGDATTAGSAPTDGGPDLGSGGHGGGDYGGSSGGYSGGGSSF